jgi:hypothetical protein
MKITIVDRSEKAALRKTRQVLCCYLDRVGSETYVGEISLDGLNKLLSPQGWAIARADVDLGFKEEDFG